MKFDIQQFTETLSTNDDAKKAAEAGAPEGRVFWALRQQAGRGRLGRQWESPEGNLYCSVILRPRLDISSYGLYSFVAGLALWDTVSDVLPGAIIELKWPNDVLVGGQKISGILLESGPEYLVIGMGLNVQEAPKESLYPVTSLAAETDATPPLEMVLNQLLVALAHWINIFDDQGFLPIRAAWLTRARKGQMRVRLPSGEISGQFGDLDERGNLCLILPDKSEHKVSAGDVFF